MFKKIFKFVKGYVIIEVTGKNKERFINMCLHNNLGIYDILPSDDGIIMKSDCADFFLMRRLVRKCRTRVRIVSKHGLVRHLSRYRRRYGFALSGLLVCIFFLMLPKYILCVEIDGIYNADGEKIMEILREHGVYRGAKKSGIDDLSEIKNAVIFGVDGVNWAWLYSEGARMRLQIQESVPVPELHDTTTPTDIIASCDGWIRRADIFRGERHVNIGMAVTSGQTLVSGKVTAFREGDPEKYMYVHSDANIIADTIRVETGDFSSKETLRIKTGASKTRLSLDIFGKKLDIFRDISCGFKDYDMAAERKNLDIPVVGYSGLGAEVYRIDEVKVSERELTKDEVLERAKEKLEEKICRKLGKDAVKESEELTYSADNGIYHVELRMHLKENIGVEIPIEE